MFEKFDNSERVARPIQKQALAWLEANWHKSNMFVLNLPTGIGKSAILRAIQEEFPGTHGIIPTNALMDQYTTSYPKVNYLKGLEHYKCKARKGSCKDNRDSGGYCTDECESTQALNAVKQGEPTLFNPMSYYYNRIDGPEVMVIDEAHKLPEMLMLLVDTAFRYADAGIKKQPETIFDVLKVIEKLKDDVAADIIELKGEKDKATNTPALKRLYSRKFTLLELIDSITTSPQDFVFYTEKRKYRSRQESYLVVKPVRCPQRFLSSCLNGRKIVLLSATILKSDMEFMGYSRYLYFDSDSPIPVDQRPIIYRPGTQYFSYKTHPEIVARWVKQVVDAYKGRNTIVHVSYAWQQKLKPYFPGAHINASKDKTETLQAFREKGGLWIASGCAEGIDLPDDQCRLVIIPMIIRPHKDDPVTNKKLRLAGGEVQFDMELIKLLIQQAGRAVRNEKDHAVTVIGDPSFPGLFLKNKNSIPKSFLAAINWRV